METTIGQRSESIKQVVEDEENQLSTFKGNLRLETLWEVGTSFEVTGEIT